MVLAAAVAVVAAAVVVAAATAQNHNSNVATKNGVTIRKCDFPFQWLPSTGGPTDADLCNSRVFCVDDVNSPYSPWYLLQSRTSSRGEAFNKNYSAYEAGFGTSLVDDYWLGLWCLHRMTAPSNNELLVRMVDRAGAVGTALYSTFSIGLPSSRYKLTVDGFDNQRSNVGDSMVQSNGMKFTAFDRDNDKNNNRNCAEKYKGGWWYRDCKINAVNNFLNGYFTQVSQRREKGVQWETWTTQSPVVSTLILFRPQIPRYASQAEVIVTSPRQVAIQQQTATHQAAIEEQASTYQQAATQQAATYQQAATQQAATYPMATHEQTVTQQQAAIQAPLTTEALDLELDLYYPDLMSEVDLFSSKVTSPPSSTGDSSPIHPSAGQTTTKESSAGYSLVG